MRTKILWLFLTFAVLIGILWQFYPLEDANKRIHQLPVAGSDFEGKDLDLTPIETSFFKGVNYIKRLYTVGEDHYFIYILDGTRNRHAVHDPTYCFRGGGWEVTKKENYPIDGGIASRYFLERGTQRKEVLLWFSDGSLQYASPYYYWWQTTLRRLTLGTSNLEPVLIVIQPLHGSNKEWNEFFEQFPQILKI